MNTTQHYNTATIHAQNKALGKAIFHYKKALQISPRDADTRHNLNLIREERINTTKPSVTDHLTSLTNIPETASLTLLITALTLAIFLKKESGKILIQLKLIMGILSIIMLIILTILTLKTTAPTAIIIQKTAVKSGPLGTLPTIFYLHDGAETSHLKTIEASGEKWHKLKTSQNFEGWVPDKAIWKL